MTDLATQVAGLTTSVNALTSAVNVAKATLDASVSAAGASATTAQAAVTTAASSATTAQAAQAAAVAVSGLSNLNGFLGQIQAGAPQAVFWYDTTRDSDGGAWRKRCAARSWATMTLGTATRGSRADFPAQTLFVVDSTNVLTIYDADQATPVMWAKIGGPGKAVDLNSGCSQVFALNGMIYLAANGQGLFVISLLGAEMITRSTAGGTAPRAYGVANANASSMAEINIPGGAVLISNTVTAVTAAVLPGAPIERATGLPKPAVAAATTAGISVIHATGLVASISAGGGYFTCAIIEGQRLAAILAANSNIVDYGPIPYASASRAAWVQYSTGTQSSGGAIQRPDTVGIGGVIDGALRNNSALWRYIEDPLNGSAGMQAMITASGNSYAGGGAFNTGWLVGDCRLALSSTSTASMTGANIASWTSAAGTTGWATTDGNLTLSISGSDLQIAETASTVTASKAVYQLSGCVVGQTYLVALTMRRGTVGAIMRSEVTDNGATTALAGGYTASTTASTVFMQFRAVDTSPKVRINFDSPYTAGQTGLVTSLSVDLAEPDRSVAAVGIRTVGTLTKSLVATTADLSAIGGFGAGNYLIQPYNPGLDFGTGDFAVVLWCQLTNAPSYSLVNRWPASGYTTGGWNVGFASGAPTFNIAGGPTAAASNPIPVAVWTQIVAARRGANLELWVNGIRAATAANNQTVTNTSALLSVGANPDGSNTSGGASVALLRISATAPTPEQIARMYADERPLFQPGAKCVLGGTSAAVQGLAHDPDTGALYAAKADGTSVFQGLVRTAHLTGLATTSNSDNHTAVAARQGGYVIATANQAVASQPAITFRDRILADRVPVAPIDANRVVFPAVATTDATPTVIARLPVAEGDELQLFVDVGATEYGAAPSERMGYQRRARVYRLPNGNVTVAAVQTLGTDYESATTTCDVTVVADTVSQTVCVQATGVAAKRLVWSTLAHVNRSGATRYAA
ncbi:LamG-like jellyroll fold domain-containing protein [Nitrospirillum amazonense]|uniref:LamG-like jellyroll fold domain-containing protein n=1 Tax=Nitrospirillum amazonense TaxID=28077 RepID=UPI002DD426D0|nr:LamG-like jellyroll fold domain-containing protein [Nitrospirillum amazonense]MEC4591591.1 LamG-like jellyroll fold domain-containing protein [Nitrospirillum amazonense]